MLNEFVYCPRLFYLEHVEGLFAHNADTLEGRTAHRRVDREGKGLPRGRKTKGKNSSLEDAGEGAGGNVAEKDGARISDGIESDVAAGEEKIHARSVSLGSDRLGVTAKLDLVEGSAEGDRPGVVGVVREVQPVEYKKGAPKESEEGPVIWPADRMQVGLQILLLRDNGYPCKRGILYYRETRQRVVLEMDAGLETWILEQIAAARACAEGPIPPPLQDSPKCVRCSLNGICLPDETRALQDEGDRSTDIPNLRLSNRQLSLGLPKPERGLPDRLSWGPFASLPEVRLWPRTPPGQVRRLVAPCAETRALYLNTPGHFVGKKGDVLTVKENKEVVAEVRLHELHHLALFGPVQLSSAVIQACCEREIPVTYFTLGGWFFGMTRGHSLKNVFTRIEQFAQAGDPEKALHYSRHFVIGKVRNQRTLLMRNHLDPPREVLRALKYLVRGAFYARSLPELLGVEGAAAQAYFSCFSGMLKPRASGTPSAVDADELDEHSVETSPQGPLLSFDFNQRNRRPPRDPVNALLSLVYSLLAKDLTLACHAVGFDPYVGFYHQPRFGRPSLALDLMEEFRPIVADSVVITLINNGMISPQDFISAGQSVALKAAARKQLFLAYEKRMSDCVTHPVFGYKVSYRRAIELQARLLAKVLTGEIEQYFPFVTR